MYNINFSFSLIHLFLFHIPVLLFQFPLFLHSIPFFHHLHLFFHLPQFLLQSLLPLLQPPDHLCRIPSIPNYSLPVSDNSPFSGFLTQYLIAFVVLVTPQAHPAFTPMAGDTLSLAMKAHCSTLGPGTIICQRSGNSER